jgi:anti-sigma factor ChrR (cupin superfamily)
MTSTRLLVLAAAVPLLLAAPASGAQTHDHRMISPSDLKWSDVPSLPPGAKIAVIEGPMSEPVPFTVRLKFPPNYQIPAHWHPAIERVTVLSGTFHMGVGEKLDKSKTMALSPGSIMIMQPKTPHFTWNQEEVVVQLNGTGPWGVTYINPADDPRKKAAAVSQ